MSTDSSKQTVKVPLDSTVLASKQSQVGKVAWLEQLWLVLLTYTLVWTGYSDKIDLDGFIYT